MEADDDGLEVDEAGFAIIRVPGEISQERWETHFTDDYDIWIPENPGISSGAVLRTAETLRQRAAERGGVEKLGELKDLKPAAHAAVAPFAEGEVIRLERKRDVPHWPTVGHVDMLGEVGGLLLWGAELKWCGSKEDILSWCVWDLLKMALLTKREDGPQAFLLAGAESATWDSSPFADIFDSKQHEVSDLCNRIVPGRKPFRAWDNPGHKSFPEKVPRHIKTDVIGRADVEAWDLRAVWVTASDDWITMERGWPEGNRPADAKYPPVP